jgi:hypothetical protein
MMLIRLVMPDPGGIVKRSLAMAVPGEDHLQSLRL